MLVGLYLLSATTCLAVVPAAWARRRNTPAAVWLVVMMAGLAGWSLIVSAAQVDPQVRSTELLLLLPTVPGTVVVVGLYGLCRSLTDPMWHPSRAERLLLGGEVGFGVTVVITHQWHHLFLEPGPDGPVFGPLFRLHGYYAGALMATGLLYVVRRRMRAQYQQRRQLDLVLVGAAVGLVGNALFVTGVTGNIDPTPLTFVVTGLVDGYAVLRLGLLELVPVARARVLESLADGVLVLDPLGRLVDLNAAALALAHAVEPPGTGDLTDLPAVALGGLVGVVEQEGRHAVRAGQQLVHLDVGRSELVDGRGRLRGHVVLLRDVTDSERQRTALVEANEALTSQLRTIEMLQSELAEQTRRDVLTGLRNRRHLMDVLPGVLAEARSSGRPLSAVVIDVDHFKRVNDTFGHAVGDQVLVEVAASLQASVRPQDIVARLGGEEFVVLFPGLGLTAAVERGWALCRGCDGVRTPDGRPVTVSAGVAAVSDRCLTAHALLAQADAALYVAKREGRNRVVSAAAG